MSECPIHRVELLLGRCWMCRGVPPGAASRSEQSARRTRFPMGPWDASQQEWAVHQLHTAACGHGFAKWQECAICDACVCEGGRRQPYCEKCVPHAAEAAQSPQVGAAAVGYECVYCEAPLMPEPCEHIRQHVVVKWVAEPGRSGSDRPPVNPPVASADPELAALLERSLEFGALCLHFGHRPNRADEFLRDARSALSRLAGQSATANEEGCDGK